MNWLNSRRPEPVAALLPRRWAPGSISSRKPPSKLPESWVNRAPLVDYYLALLVGAREEVLPVGADQLE